MDFDLSSDQEALVEAAQALLNSRASIEKVREAADRPDRIDRSLWSEMAEQGWMAVELPESAGGLGMGFVEVAVLCERLGAHLAPVPYAGTILSLAALERAVAEGAGGETGRLSELAEALSQGTAVGSVAWIRRPDQLVASPAGTSPGGAGPGGTSPGGAGPGGGDSSWVLTGRTDPVIFGPVADVVVLAATTEGADGTRSRSLFAVTDLPSASRTPQSAMDLTRSISWLELDRTPAILLGDERACDELTDRAAVAASAEMLGAAARVLEMTVEYAKDRQQFGRPIGSFQAVKHRCADMLVDVEGMRSAVYYAAWCIAAGNPDAATAASAAKVWCSEAASRVMGSGLQVHGGIGFTWEHDLHLFVKRSQLDQVSFGTAPYHRDRLAAILRPLAEAGLPVM
jgi:alkylation response protein AidB-like acyl-CoA dehydrogenase